MPSYQNQHLGLILLLRQNYLTTLEIYSPPHATYNQRMSKYIHNSHNIAILIYHLVFPAKYQRAVLKKGGIAH